MSEEEINRLAILPQELLIEILSYLTSLDVINISSLGDQFAQICACTKLVKQINLFLEYNLTHLPLTNFLKHKPIASLIKSLNLNSIYWIPGSKIKGAISTLVSLEELFILDTGISLCPSDIYMFKKLTNLKKLSLSFRTGVLKKDADYSRDVFKEFPKLTHLCVLILQESNLNDLYTFISVLRDLRTLMICNILPTKSLDFERIPKFDRIIFKLLGTTVRYQCMETLYNPVYYNTYDGHQIFATKDMELFSIDQSPETTYMPFNLLDFSKLYLEKPKHVIVDSLNIACIRCSKCSLDYNELTNILYSNYCCKLKRLSISYCLILGYENHKLISNDSNCSESIRKKRRKLNSINLFEALLKHCPDLEELEIWECRKIKTLKDTSSFHSIQNFKQLKRLTLDKIPLNVNGDFLVSIFRNCEMLHTLRIKTEFVNVQLNNFLCLAMKYAKRLENLRIHVKSNLSIDRLLTSMPSGLNLRSLYIETVTLSDFTENVFYKFLEDHKTLTFMYILIHKDFSKARIKNIYRHLKSITKDTPKHFHFGDTIGPVTDYPVYCIEEVIKNRSRVANIDIFSLEWCDI